MNHSPPTVLIAQTGSAENALLTTPVATAIREDQPNTQIIWATSKNGGPIIRATDLADEVVEVPDRWYRNPTEMASIRRQLRNRQIDIALQCESSPRRPGQTSSAWVARLSGARRRISLGSGSPRRVIPWSRLERVPAVFQHLTDRQLELLIPLGVHPVGTRWPSLMGDSARNWARSYRQSLPETPLLLMHPTATIESAQWPVDRFASTARYARDRYRYQTLVSWHTFEDRLRAESIVALSQQAARLAPDTNIQSLAALIDAADLVLAGDSIALHLAVAVNTPTVAVYGGTDPASTGPHGRPAVSIQSSNKPRRWPRHASVRGAMHAVGVQHVCMELDQERADLTATPRPRRDAA
ncbi:MAG: glycosyltransferase family 9 protein [Planctomycetota bacterium]